MKLRRYGTIIGRRARDTGRAIARSLRAFHEHGLDARRSNPERATGAQRQAVCLEDIARSLLVEAEHAARGTGGTDQRRECALRIVDGARPFADVLDAFMAAEESCDPRDLIALSGIYPNHRAQGRAERHVRNWFGEAWKLKLCLARYRPDLRLLAVDTYPSGLLLVGRLDPGSGYLRTLRDRLLVEYGPGAGDVPPEILRRRGATGPRAKAIRSLVVEVRRIPDASRVSSARFERTSIRRRDGPGAPAAGIYLTHIDSPRIRSQFDRLVKETSGAIDWQFAYNPDGGTSPRMDVPCPSAEHLMPRRHSTCLNNGGVQGGYVDVAVVPAALAVDREFTWVLEYDVDYSGNWLDFFAQFEASGADLLTTSLSTRTQTPGWSWWHGASTPHALPDDAMIHAFLPIARFSRRFLRAYVSEIERDGWRGHFEFTIPTIAAALGFVLEDIGGGRADHRPARPNYLNNPSDPQLRPGTFVWRPARSRYYHESPTSFEIDNMLYHPVKPDVATSTRPPPS